MRECDETVVSSITIAFPIRLNGSIVTRDPILVLGMIQQFGPIVQSFPIITGPEITVFGPMVVPFPMWTGPFIVAWRLDVPSLSAGRCLRRRRLSLSRSQG